MTDKTRIKELESEVEALKQKLEEANNLMKRQKDVKSSKSKGSECDLASLIDNLQGVLYRCRNDKDWTMEFISEGIYDLAGYKASDFIMNEKRSFNSIVHPEDQKSLWHKWQVAIKGGGYFEDEYRIIAADGTIKWVWERGRGIVEAGKTTVLEGSISDISSKKKILLDLQVKEELLKLIGSMSKVGGWEFDIKSKEGSWTEEVARIHDLDPKVQTNAELGLSYFIKDHQPIIRRAIENVIQNGTPYDLELELISAEGVRKWVRTKGKAIHEDNEIVGIRGIFQDITERKETSLALENERLWLKTLIKTIPDMVWLKNPEGIYISCNPRFEEFFGATEREIQGRTDYDFMNEELASFFRQKDLEAVRANKPTTNLEWVTFASDGHQELLETVKTPMYDSLGNLIGVLGIARDITEKRKTEEELILAKEKAEESDKLKTAFLQNMSHEIRTPMNAIMGFAELLPDVFDDKEQLKYYTEIINSRSDDLLHIIDGILDIARIESGQVKISIEECHFTKWYSETQFLVQEYKKNMKKEAVEIRFDTESEVPPTIFLDQGKTKQVLVNLINNAIKFTDDGFIDVCCKHQGEELFFKVSDSGVGIQKEDQERIFERFAQAQTATSKPIGGTGLGLAIVKGILNTLGGSIWLESEPGKGSTFYFTVPFSLEMPE